MMYSKGLVAVIKHEGKVCREVGEIVQIPFGSTYTILLKNLSDTRAGVSVSIDGESIAEGNEFILAPKQEVELKRFIKNGNLNEGNAFKFIERTQKIEQHKGIGVEDGLIKIEYYFERKVAPLSLGSNNNYLFKKELYGSGVRQANVELYSNRGDFTYCSNEFSDVQGATYDSSSFLCSSAAPTRRIDATQSNVTKAVAGMPGITVPGEVVKQTFYEAQEIKNKENFGTIVLKLQGYNGDKKVEQPLLVKSKQKCDTCGHLNKSSAKFCSECGTSLIVV